jgi:transcriptional regulator with XRE-family HTH domain
MERLELIKKMKERKTDLGFTFETISNLSNVSKSTIQRALSGENTDYDNLERIANSLGIELEIQIKNVKSKKALLNSRVESLAKSVVDRVVWSSALELQAPSEEAAKQIYKETVERIKKMPEEKIWRLKI